MDHCSVDENDAIATDTLKEFRYTTYIMDAILWSNELATNTNM